MHARSAVLLGIALWCAVPATAAIPAAERAALIALYDSTSGPQWTDRSNWLGAPGSENTWHGVTTDAGNTTVLQIVLDANGLAGSIPVALRDLTNLEYLNLGDNALAGEIPGALGSLPLLSDLRLGNNRLTGGIPPALANLSNLTLLVLSGNELSGEIPAQLGSLPLEGLILGTNQLTGEIPSSLGDLTAMRDLRLDGNRFTGEIPPAFAALAQLVILDLRDNRLTGTIPSLGNCPDLVLVALGGNQLSGAIPSAFGDLGSLQSLWLDGNRLSGAIPKSLGRLASLQSLLLQRNQLSGRIPAELGDLASLQYLDLAGNRLIGKIPQHLGDLRSLVMASSDIRFNALHTADPALRAFLNSRQVGGDWEGSQTVAPSELVAGATTSSSASLHWTPISYQGDSGGYRVYYSRSPLGAPTLWGTTADKTVSSVTVGGLDPSTTYDFRLETMTLPHGSNPNTVVSERTANVTATTAGGPPAGTLIENGGFEAGLAPWTPNDFASGDGVDCTTALAGACSIHLHGRRASAGHGEEGYLWLKQGVAGQPAGTFTFSASSRASGAHSGARAKYRAVVRFKHQGGGSTARMLEFSRGTHGWETLATAIAVPATQRIVVELDYFDQTGEAWFDGVALEADAR